MRMKAKNKTTRSKAEKNQLKKLGLLDLDPQVRLSATGDIHVCFGGVADREKVKPEAQVYPPPPSKKIRLEC
jgi:hypothetical protein